MSRKPIRAKEVQNPERILSNMLQDYVNGSLDESTFLYRASVVAVDQVGGALETIPPNPKNSIRARVITNARDKDVADEDLTVFWPIFPHDIMPIKEGEHVYVIYEDAAVKRHGLWFCRIPEPATTDNPNLTLGVQKYQDDPANAISSVGAEKAVQDSDITPAPATQSPEFVPQEVPRFRARIGDRVIEGSNNTVIIMGRDRPTAVTSGQVSDAGSVDIVAGRAGEEDLDPENDKSRLVVSMNSDPDTDFNITVGPPSGPKASIIAKSDEIRIISRSGTKIVVEGGDLHVEGQNIFLGDKATESVIKGDAFNALWIKVLSLIANHNHPSPVPNSPSPVLVAQLVQALIDLTAQSTGPVLSKTVKVKG